MQTTVESDLRALQAEMGQLRQDMAEIGQTLRETFHDSRREAIGQVRRTSARLVGSAGQTARAAMHEIEDRPLPITLAAGAAVAVVLGLLLYARQH